MFIETQQNGSRIKNIFRQGEINALLKDSKTGLREGLEFFRVSCSWNWNPFIQAHSQATATNDFSDVRDMEKNAEELHQEVLDMMEALPISDKASSVWVFHYLYKPKE